MVTVCPSQFATRRTLFHVLVGCGLLFFFSSRRRHTRSDRDWSSYVCSSDLSSASTAALSPITPISATSPARAGVQARNSRSAIILGMRPVAIIRHSASEGPAYFATYLEDRKSVV